MKTLILGAWFWLFAAELYAHEMPVFGFPVLCEVSQCFIQNYPDALVGKGYADFMGRHLSYEGHDGVDIRIRHLDEDVVVLAMADGTVLRMRDGVKDGMPPKDLMLNRYCGNGVLLDHGNGWQSQYCHLKRGSVMVALGQKLRVGEALGRIGQSGKAEFPHLHAEFIYQGKAIDPFTGKEILSGKPMFQPLWRKDMRDKWAVVDWWRLGHGMVVGVDGVEAARKGAALPKPIRHEPLFLWAEFAGLRAGDRWGFVLHDAKGQPILREEMLQPRNQAISYRYAGVKPPKEGWPAGRYCGTITLKRQGDKGWQDDVCLTLKPF